MIQVDGCREDEALAWRNICEHRIYPYDCLYHRDIRAASAGWLIDLTRGYPNLAAGFTTRTSLIISLHRRIVNAWVSGYFSRLKHHRVVLFN
jgi:hypothetical protein